jgi:amidase
MKTRTLLHAMTLALTFAAGVAEPLTARAESKVLNIETATIADLDLAFANGKLTSEKLVDAYLKRIDAYDKKGPGINAVITLNPNARAEAKALDIERKRKGPRSPLHGVPILLKDNYDTFDLPTTAGSSLLKGSIPPDDAFVVKKLRNAGAIVLAKVNLSEFASGSGGPNGFSSMGGQTHNPHDLARGPAGSSGGTGAGLASVFAQFGMGTDTGGSIRGPSSANGIVGLKPTYGLLSRDGIVPLTLSYDTGGPMARSVYDIAVALGAMTGVDPADAATNASAGKGETDYTKYLKTGALKGARIGVARDYFGQSDETDRVMEEAIAKLRELGAVVVDPVKFPETITKARTQILEPISGREFRVYLNQYLATLKPEYPKTLAALIAKAEDPSSGYNNPWRLKAMKEAQAKEGDLDTPQYLVAKNEGLALVRAAVLATLNEQHLDALVYPTSPKPAVLIPPPPPEEARAPSATSIANHTGFPDLIVPAGMTKDGLPVTISFFGPAFSEPKLLAYGYDFEQATHAIRLPKNTPALPSDSIK